MAFDHSDILRLLRSGDPRARGRAIEVLSKCYETRVCHLVQRLAPQLTDPRQIWHDTVLGFEKKVISGDFNEAYDFWPLLKSIAEHKIKDAIRSDQRRKQNNDAYQSYLLPQNDGVLNPTEKALFNEEMIDLMAKALQQLDPACRNLLKRYWFDGVALKDLIDELDSPSEDALKQRHKRCRDKLRQILGKDPRKE